MKAGSQGNNDIAEVVISPRESKIKNVPSLGVSRIIGASLEEPFCQVRRNMKSLEERESCGLCAIEAKRGINVFSGSY